MSLATSLKCLTGPGWLSSIDLMERSNNPPSVGLAI
uniref:Uncharacterized protein n=1 Tax=Arundo donax TaxID=35708 RepID=A0A0A9BNI9_ARUDO